MARAGSKIAIAGLIPTGPSILTIYDRATDSESITNPATAKTEIYQPVGASDDVEVLFDGLRVSDNTCVMGKVIIATGVF